MTVARRPLAVTIVIALILSLVGGSLFFFHNPDKAQAAWYSTGGTWNYRQKITINHTKVPNTDQTDFPVLVKITDAANPVFTKAQADGDDILFTASDETTRLSYEIEKFTPTEGSRELDAWVKITSLSHTADTILYMYYGNSSATDPTAPERQAVWSNGYAGVWHLGETGANPTVNDSTGANNSTSNSADPTTTGKINGGMTLTAASSDSIGFGDVLDVGIGNFSLSAWVKTTQATAGQIINKRFYNTAPYGYDINITSGQVNARTGFATDATSTGTINNDAWRYIEVTFNRVGNTIIYIDGVQDGSGAGEITDIDNTMPLTFGDRNQDTHHQYFNGSMDEIHISSSARSADWIATEYANQNDPGTFFGLEAEATGDMVAPTNPTSVTGKDSSGGSTTLTINNFYNYPTPYFEWPAAEAVGGAADTGNTYVSGVAGYYSYFGTTCDSDPAATEGILPDAGPIAGLHYSATANLTIPDLGSTEGTYCLRIRTADNAGNISDTLEAFVYKYDITNPLPPAFIAADPSGYSSTDSFGFTWPAALDTINAYSSGVGGYQYERGDGSGDTWSATIPTASVDSIPSYQTGENVFIVRSIDNAGNTSDQVQTTYYFSDNSPVKPTGLTADPDLSDSNSFSFSWTAPVHARPIVDYGYSINAVPTINNLTWLGSAATTLPTAPYATIQGVNTLYLIAKDDSGAYSLDAANYATEDFNATTVAPPIPIAVSIKDSSNRVLMQYSLDIQWQAGSGQDPASFDHYSIERSTDGIAFAEVDVRGADDTEFIDTTNLNGTTTYYYRIKAVDNAGSASSPSTIVSKTPTFKYDTPPTIVSEPEVSAKSTISTVSWVVDRASKASIRFGKSQDSLSDSRSNTTTETSHTIQLSGLAPETTYYYQVQSLDNLRSYSFETAYSAVYQFTTLPAPSIANVSISNITLTSVDISWETSSASNTKVYYGTSIGYGSVLPESDDSMTTLHSIKIPNLAHTTRYHFKIAGTDIDGNTLTSDDYIFDTLPMPTISTIDAAADFSGPAPVVVITWLTNVPTTSSVEYIPKESTDGVAYEESQSALVTRHSVTLSNLLNQTDYQFTIFGVDQFGNKATSDLQVLHTNADSRPPKISNVTIESSNVGSGNTNEAMVVVYWQTDEFSTSQVAYDEGLEGNDYRKLTPPDLSLTKNHIVVISGLRPGSPYHFQILSKDETGNLAKGTDQAVVTGQVTESVLSIIGRTLNNLFGWLSVFRL